MAFLYSANASPKLEQQQKSPFLSVATSTMSAKLANDIISVSSSPAAHPSSPVPSQHGISPPHTTSCSPVFVSSSPATTESNNIAANQQTPKQKLALEIANVLKKRLLYAAFKVKQGWENESIDRVVELTNEKFEKISPATKQKTVLMETTTAKKNVNGSSGHVLGVAVKRKLSGVSNGKEGINASVVPKEGESALHAAKKARNTSFENIDESARVIGTRGKSKSLTLNEDVLQGKVGLKARIGHTKVKQSVSPQISSDNLTGIATVPSSGVSATFINPALTTANSFEPKSAATAPMAKPSVLKPKFDFVQTNIVPSHIPISSPPLRTMPSLPLREQYSQQVSRPAYSSYPSDNFRPYYPSYPQSYLTYAYPPTASAYRPLSAPSPMQNYPPSNYSYPLQQPQHATYVPLNLTEQPPNSQYLQYRPQYQPLEHNYHAPYSAEYPHQLSRPTGYQVNGKVSGNQIPLPHLYSQQQQLPGQDMYAKNNGQHEKQ
ncbi:hypothetical protein HK100_005618 [Physocladia obscura]|uniref:Uncharacterized protein n=1 Tax=Physocladia obscura TaxID=109957 RepID=A0AAD5XJ87_9FUNG|nr:hypothetical protein HK100_005618 [Physocladia obscura]